MTSWYVDSSAAGANNGTSLEDAWQTFSAINQASLSAGDVVYIYPGTTGYMTDYTLSKGGTSQGARIIYKGVNMPTIRGEIDGGNINNVAVIGCHLTQFSGNGIVQNISQVIRLANSTGWLIQDNNISGTWGGGVNGAFNTNNRNNIIRSNIFDNICLLSGGQSNAATLQLFGHYNLVEYNSFYSGLDRTRAFGTGNIIRNNYFGASNTLLYPYSTQYPHHTDSFQSFENAVYRLERLMYEKNFDMDNLGPEAHGVVIQDNDGIGMNWAITRFNILARTSGPAYIFRGFDRLYGYNLTSVGVQTGNNNTDASCVTYDATPVGDLQDWRNNTWSFCQRTVDGTIFADVPARITNFTGLYQHRYQAGPLPVDSTNLANVDPQFVSLASDNLALDAGSPLIGAGGPLTLANGNGTDSTTLIVDDAYKFSDGWGIADPDIIKVGAGAFVTISSINYPTNTITLAEARSWSDNDPVIVKGMEDVGALPSSYIGNLNVTNTTSLSLPAGAASLTATVPNTDTVRMVEFFVDGIPVGMNYTSPYSVSWTSDGAQHTIEARAYNMWASQTLWVSEEITVNGPASIKRNKRLGRNPKIKGLAF